MNEKRIIEDLVDALGKGDVVGVVYTTDLFCTKVLDYKKVNSHSGGYPIGIAAKIKMTRTRTSDFGLKPENVDIRKIIVVTNCSHYSKNIEDDYGKDSGLIFKIAYSGLPQSILQRLGLRKSNFQLNAVVFEVYGEEWIGGEEMPTPSCYRENLGVKAPKLRNISVKNMIEQYQRRVRGAKRIPVE